MNYVTVYGTCIANIGTPKWLIFLLSFQNKNVTPFGGMSLMKRFVDSLDIRDKLKERDLCAKRQFYSPFAKSLIF